MYHREWYKLEPTKNLPETLVILKSINKRQYIPTISNTICDYFIVSGVNRFCPSNRSQQEPPVIVKCLNFLSSPINPVPCCCWWPKTVPGTFLSPGDILLVVSFKWPVDGELERNQKFLEFKWIPNFSFSEPFTGEFNKTNEQQEETFSVSCSGHKLTKTHYYYYYFNKDTSSGFHSNLVLWPWRGSNVVLLLLLLKMRPLNERWMVGGGRVKDTRKEFLNFINWILQQPI